MKVCFLDIFLNIKYFIIKNYFNVIIYVDLYVYIYYVFKGLSVI